MRLMICSRLKRKPKKREMPECLGTWDYWGEFDCEYAPKISCE